MQPALMLSPQQAKRRQAKVNALVPQAKAAEGNLSDGVHRCGACDNKQVYVKKLVNPIDCRKQEIWGSSTSDPWEYAMTCASCGHSWNE